VSTETCDYDIGIAGEHHGPCAVYVFQRRPSNPADLCAILGLCEPCATRDGWPGPAWVCPADEVPYIGTFPQVVTWAENHGHTHDILWVS
jgi:hypothetical protein